MGKRHRRIRARGATGQVAGAATEKPGLRSAHRPRTGLFAVGTALSGGPPRRSQRARLTHWAPALGAGVEAHAWPGMLDADGW
jgi:hypothetical protein